MVTVSRVSRVGLVIALGLVFATPAFPQGNESKDWQSIQDQKDAKKKTEMLESFIKKYPASARRPGADSDLVEAWAKNNDNSKIVAFVEDFKKAPPASPDGATKAKIYSQGMLAAYSNRDASKAAEFGGAALEADPNSYQALYFLAAADLPNPAKAMEYAEKVIALPRPQNLAPDVHARNMARLHGKVALPLFAQQKFSEARDHLEAVIKSDPKNQEAHFRHGFANVNLMGRAVKAAQDANNSILKLRIDNKAAEAEAAFVKQEAAEREALELRDAALESLAKAMAIGGQYTEQAKPIFESLYQNKNKTLDGADALISQKKQELGL